MVEFTKNYREIYSEGQLELIEKEFKRKTDICYLDNVGAVLYSETQIQNVFSELQNNVFANPHARNLSSKNTEDAIDIARNLVLNHFNTNSDEYSVIFTSGATESLKIVAENFAYTDENDNENSIKGIFAYLENNHTSVLGMRSYAKKFTEISTEKAFQILSEDKTDSDKTDNTNSLFVYPAQCNFSGTKYPLDWIEKIKDGWLNKITNSKSKNWFVLLDSATYVSTNHLDLSKYKPDFVPISFYKIFGYPSGLGALLVKKSAEHVLHKKYFGGGTVLMALSSENVMIPRINVHERFEDGTLPFLSILTIKHGFNNFKRLKVNFDLISRHTFSLAQYVYYNLLTLHHSNGMPVVQLYHETIFNNIENQGGIINFNLLRDNGEYIGYSEVLHFSNLHGVQLRTGCFCNPGACQRFLKLTTKDIRKNFDAGHVCGDQNDLIEGYPTGSVRISFAYYSTKKEADIFLKMIENCFIAKPIVRKLPENFSTLKQKSLFNKNQSRTNKKENGVNIENLREKKFNLDEDKSNDAIETKTSKINIQENSVNIKNTKQKKMNVNETRLNGAIKAITSQINIEENGLINENIEQNKLSLKKLKLNGTNETITSKINIQENSANIENTKQISLNNEARETESNGTVESSGVLKSIFLFPVKSCGAFSVTNRWELTATGLKYDRQWMIVNSTGVCVTQKQNRRLCLIKPKIDIDRSKLILNFQGFSDIEISLKTASKNNKDGFLCQSKVCGDSIQGWDCGDEVSDWISEVLEITGLRLLQHCNPDTEFIGRSSKKNDGPQLSLANKAQYLLLNYSSVEWLKNKIEDEDFKDSIDNMVKRFRPNFVVDFKKPFRENEFEEYEFENLIFKSGGKCTRCQMICIDQETGDISREPLKSLSREFKGKISFGIYLNQEHIPKKNVISIGMTVTGKNCKNN